MASLSSRFCTVRNGVASRVCHAMMEAKRITCKGAAATCTALSSRKTATGILRSATAPAALLRTSAVCCTACQDADIVEIQLKVSFVVCRGKKYPVSARKRCFIFSRYIFSFIHVLLSDLLCRLREWCVMDAVLVFWKHFSSSPE